MNIRAIMKKPLPAVDVTPVDAIDRGTQRHKHTLLNALALGAAGIVLIIAPYVVSSYQVFNITGVLAYGVAALGLNLITGYSGQISLGHNLFFALGAYVAALSTSYLGVNQYLAIPVAGAACFVVGILVGFPAQRLKGLYLALVTLALAVSVTPIIKNFKEITGGAAGLLLSRPESPLSGLSQDGWIYYVVLLFAAICFWFTRNLVSGGIGRALSGVREAELSSASMGVNISRHKIVMFGFGAMLGGIGGALLSFSIGYLAPDSFTLTLAISFLAAVVVGGLGTITGALVAGAFLQYVPGVAAGISQSFAGAVYGAILILCMFLMPKGIVGSIAHIRNVVRERRAQG